MSVNEYQVGQSKADNQSATRRDTVRTIRRGLLQLMMKEHPPGRPSHVIQRLRTQYFLRQSQRLVNGYLLRWSGVRSEAGAAAKLRRGSVTFTDSEIDASSDAATVGNTPRRQADYIFNVTPKYSTDKWTAGATIAGTDEVFVQNVNQAKFDGYATVNAYFSYYFSDSLSVSVNANNLFDEEGFSEGEEGAPSVGDYVRIRSINGRTTSRTLRYDLF